MKRRFIQTVILIAVSNLIFSKCQCQSWLLNGNSGTGGTQFVGTIDGNDLLFKTNNIPAIRLNIDNQNPSLMFEEGQAWDGAPGTGLLFGVYSGQDAQRLCICPSNFDFQTDERGANIALHGNNTIIQKGQLHLVGGESATGDSASIRMFTNRSGYGTSTESMTILGNGNVGIGSANPKGILELKSTTEGFVLPRMTKVERNAIYKPLEGTMIYQTDNSKGIRVFNGDNWIKFKEMID